MSKRMLHLWIRAEQRKNEKRVGITPLDASKLLRAGIKVTVEDSADRIIPIEEYNKVGCEIAKEHGWPSAPKNTIILGLKELPKYTEIIEHKHIMFGHAFKGQTCGLELLKKFKAGKGILYDLEYLTNPEGRRLAAFGYWAGFAGAAVSLKAYADQQNIKGICGPVSVFENKDAMLDNVQKELLNVENKFPKILVVGAKGRVGTGAIDFCEAVGLTVTKWDIEETKKGEPFPEIFEHEVFLNCILAKPGGPIFIRNKHLNANRNLRVIGDISCDPDSSFNPLPIYNSATNWEIPVERMEASQTLDVMAIDNLPSLLPYESSIDFSKQLLPLLLDLNRTKNNAWDRAEEAFWESLKEV
ncbi:saccharopine dehydrogenase [Paracoccaceae bacterium]|nr:saccharopine dehydrogenase [Paracoccaceae bacterium]